MIRFFVGSYALPSQTGLYCCALNLNAGDIEMQSVRPGSLNPSFIAHPGGSLLYAVNEAIQEFGRVAAFSILPDGRLSLVNSQSSFGEAPCHVSISMSHNLLIACNYLGGNLSVHRLLGSAGIAPCHQTIAHSGHSGGNPRQHSAHPHSAVFSEDESLVFVPDLGCDTLFVYAIQNEQLILACSYSLAQGSGPRHIVLHPYNHCLYLVNELSNTITVLKIENNVIFEIQSVSTIPDDFDLQTTAADIHISPDGRFVYVSNRGHDSIVFFSVGENGRLDFAGYSFSGGKTPRNFAISPDGNYLLVANQDSNQVSLFDRDAQTGIVGKKLTELAIPQPSCIIF